MEIEAIKSPQTYFEWANILKLLNEKTNDDKILEIMMTGTLHWQPGVSTRFLKRLLKIINSRLDLANQKFQHSISQGVFEERTIVQSLLSFRKEIEFILKMLDIPALPDENRNALKNELMEFAKSVQNSLEESAKTDRTGKLINILKNNRIDLINAV